MIYELSQKLIQKVEQSVCGSPPKNNRVIYFYLRELKFPFKLLGKGFSLWYRDFFKFSILYMLFFIVSFWFLYQLKGSQETQLIADFLFWVSLFVPVCLSMFSSPSSYCFYGINSELVNDASSFLHENGIKSSAQAKAICEVIKLFEKRIDIRLITFRGALALLWGFVLYLLSTISKKPLLVQQAESNNLALLSLVFLLFYVLVESYAKASDLIFKTAQFACTEVSCSLKDLQSESLAPSFSQMDEDDESKEVVLESLHRSWQEAKEGKVRPVSELWDGIDV